jgi:pyruvate kinase
MSETNVVQLAPNRTKIVATIGPGSRTPAILRKLIEDGVDVFRLNFSHGTHDEHSAVLADIRTLSRELGQRFCRTFAGPRFDLGQFLVTRWHAHWVKNSRLSPSAPQTAGEN